jgi:hypothetical protein
VTTGSITNNLSETFHKIIGCPDGVKLNEYSEYEQKEEKFDYCRGERIPLVIVLGLID